MLKKRVFTHSQKRTQINSDSGSLKNHHSLSYVQTETSKSARNHSFSMERQRDRHEKGFGRHGHHEKVEPQLTMTRFSGNQSECRRPSVMCVPENNLHDFGSDHSRQVLAENDGGKAYCLCGTAQQCGTVSNYCVQRSIEEI